MNIIICGAGKVGFSISKQLASQGHSVTVIDQSSEDIKKINDNNTAVLRGYKLTQNEKIIRDVINSIMCNYYVDFYEIAERFETNIYKIKEVIAFNKEKFKDFIDLNFMEIEDEKITISNNARLYIRNIAMEFDPLMDTKIGTYSKTI